MREMKESGIEWIGEIPANWNITKIKYLTRCYDGKRKPIDSSKRQDGIYPYWGAGSITDYIDDYIFDEELILLGEDGAPFFDDYRPVSFLVNERIWVNNHIHVLKSKENVDSSFLVHFLNSVNYRKYINGSILNKLTQSNMNNIEVCLPSFSLQQIIANFLDEKCGEIDSLKSDIQKQIETLQEYKKSVITEAVTKGLNPNVEVKDSGIEWCGKIPVNWNVLPNKYIMKKVKNICVKYNNEPILSLTMKGVVKRDLDAGGKMPTSFDGYQYIIPNNLLMCLFDYDVTPRCIGLINDYGITSPAYSQFKMKNENSERYYYYYYLMIDNTKELLHLAKNLRHSFTEEQLGLIKTPMPPIKEQQIIADFLDEKCNEIDEIIKTKNKQLETLEQYKKSLIYEYVTGKKEVLE